MTQPLNENHTQLQMFFGVFRRFNGNMPLDKKLRTEIENFLEYSWSNDPTQALQKEQDRELFNQLPHSVRQRIYTEFLFDVFLEVFKGLFLIPRQEIVMKNKRQMFKTNGARSFRDLTIATGVR